VQYWTQLATEQFPPSDIVGQAADAEEAGFDAVNISDHFQPWWEPGEAGHAWVMLGAIGEVTSDIPIGTGVTAPVFRHNPALTAQAWATLEEMYPGRAFLGIGSGESLNESPVGMDWPPVREQVDRMDEALEIIGRLFDGERFDYHGKYFNTKQAYLHTNTGRRPPIYISAFGPRAAGVAARRGDGVWTLADPENAPEVIEAYKAACDDAGKEPGEVILQTGFSWAEDDDAALEACRVWKGAQPDEYYSDDWHIPEEMYRHGEETLSDDEFKEAYIISSDPQVHVDRIRQVEEMGPTVVCLQNASGVDPHAAFGVYGENVLPALRG
jgi:coenzyme F420-dependent glucose-6-phosphate dehydrogenase